jgi:hypothetical protein
MIKISCDYFGGLRIDGSFFMYHYKSKYTPFKKDSIHMLDGLTEFECSLEEGSVEYIELKEDLEYLTDKILTFVGKHNV